MWVDLNKDRLGTPVYNIPALNNAIKNIISTRKGSVPGLPSFGTNIERYVFEIFSPIVRLEIQKEVISALATWEPRISIIKIDVIENLDYNSLDLYIYYKIISTGEEYDTNIRLVSN
jgi:phage baseplate assembly protein W